MNKILITSLVTAWVYISSPVNASDERAVEPTSNGADIVKTCAVCHGLDGNSPTPNFPRIAGQHQDYLLYALKSYKNGNRKNAIMAGIVTPLSEEDMEYAARYFSQQQGLAMIGLEKQATE